MDYKPQILSGARTSKYLAYLAPGRSWVAGRQCRKTRRREHLEEFSMARPISLSPEPSNLVRVPELLTGGDITGQVIHFVF